MQFKTLTIKNDWTFVRFSEEGKEGLKDSTYPGSDSPPVLPSITFVDAIEAFEASVVSGYYLSTEFNWRLASLQMEWKGEIGEYKLQKITLKGFSEELGSMPIAINTKSAKSIPASVIVAFEKLLKQCEEFVRGESAQGSLFKAEQEAA